MVRRLLVVTGCTAALVLLCGEPVAQDRQVYRYTDSDGRVVYSDRAPTSGAKDLTARRVNGNTIETSGLPIAVQQATERFPVTLYTFACGEPCDSAQALLNRRGVPFSTVNVDEANNVQKLQALTGEQTAPVLQVGDKLVQKGFNEAKWNAMLDQAGYPKTPARRTQSVRSINDAMRDAQQARAAESTTAAAQ